MTRPHPTHARGLPDAPRWLAVALPAVVWPVLFACAFLYRPFYDFMQSKEGGVEWLGVAVLVFGIAHGLALLIHHRSVLPRRWLAAWFTLGVIGMVLFMGEEISWGQHLGLWKSEDLPEVIHKVNDQGETNFHNMTNLLDQGPTNLIVVGTFVAVCIVPLVQRYRGRSLQPDRPGYWFWPTRACLVASLGVLIIPFVGRTYRWTTGDEVPQTLRHSEIHECYIAMLMATYMVSAFHRARAAHRGITPLELDNAP